MEPFRYTAGAMPLVISMPHTAEYVPPHILERFTTPAKHLPDTDWHIEKLYSFACEMGAHMLAATHSRYVVDLNRAPDDASLYPGKFTTGLVPTTLFDGTPIYKKGQEPDAQEIKERLKLYWQPYHQKLQAVIGELKARHEKVVVLDAHSICSQVPTLFEGTLPDLNLGTADGKSASPELAVELETWGRGSGYSFVHNGRFKGGYIIRQYGQPEGGVHAVQLELAQKNYMQEMFPYSYDEQRAGQLQHRLRQAVSAMIDWVCA